MLNVGVCVPRFSTDPKQFGTILPQQEYQRSATITFSHLKSCTSFSPPANYNPQLDATSADQSSDSC